MELQKQQLIVRLEKFLKTYAVVSRQDTSEFNSPDANELKFCLELLKEDKRISRYPWSEWGGGGYKPYSSKEGREEHDFILKQLEKYVE